MHLSALHSINVAALGLSALVFLLAYQKHRAQHCFAYWSAGNTMAAIGGQLLGGAAASPMLLLLTGVGQCLYWFGLRRFFGRPLPWRTACGVLLVSAIAMAAALRWDEVSSPPSMAIAQACLSVLVIATAWDLFLHMRGNAFGQLLGVAMIIEVLLLAVGLADNLTALDGSGSRLAASPADPLPLLSACVSVLLTFVTTWCSTLLVSEQMRSDLSHIASTDTLTGLLNRRAFLDRAPDCLPFQGSDDGFSGVMSAAVLAMDIDHFKAVNDFYGHQAGDEVLRQFGALLRRSVRARDLIGRVGGEEFWALLPDVTPDEARRVAERIRTSLAEADIHFGNQTIHSTVSIGLTMITGQDTLETALARADRALYAAKNGGRNRVAADTPPCRAAIELEWGKTAFSAASSVLPAREAP